MWCVVIWYHLYDIRNSKSTYGGVLLLISCRLEPATLIKVTFLHGCFSHFLIGTKSCKACHILCISSYVNQGRQRLKVNLLSYCPIWWIQQFCSCTFRIFSLSCNVDMITSSVTVASTLSDPASHVFL